MTDQDSPKWVLWAEVTVGDTVQIGAEGNRSVVVEKHGPTVVISPVGSGQRYPGTPDMNTKVILVHRPEVKPTEHIDARSTGDATAIITALDKLSAEIAIALSTVYLMGEVIESHEEVSEIRGFSTMNDTEKQVHMLLFHVPNEYTGTDAADYNLAHELDHAHDTNMRITHTHNS